MRGDVRCLNFLSRTQKVLPPAAKGAIMSEIEKLLPVGQPRLVLPLPCPFCGCKPVIATQGKNWIVYCKASRCQVNPGTFPVDLKKGEVLTRDHAVECWNRRPNSKRISWQNARAMPPATESDHGK